MNPQMQQGCYSQSIQPGAYIIEHDAPAFGEILEPADGEGLGDIEEAKENEGDEGVTPVGAAAEEGDPLAGDFVDDYELGIVAAGFAGGDGGGGDAEEEREGDGGEQGQEQGLGGGMEEFGVGGPEKDGGDRSPGAGTRLAEARAEEGGNCPGPEGSAGGRRRQILPWRLLVMGVSAVVRAEPAKVFEDFGVEDGGADLVDAHGPLAEIDLAAAVTAEGEILVVETDQHAAGGAAEEFCGFFLCGH